MVELEFAETKAVYDWNADRYSHRIFVKTSDGWLDLLESVEGTSEEPWPVSPPWQQIVRESMGHLGEDVLFGVGLSGNGHWSIAVHPTNSEPSQDHPALFRGLALDIACKTSKPATQLGSSWKVGPLWNTVSVEPQQIVFATHSPGTEIKVFLNVMHGIVILRDENSHFSLELRPDTDVTYPRTHRWAMRVETSQKR